MQALLLVALGGALGAAARYGVSQGAVRLGLQGFVATGAINVAGSVAIGACYVLIVERMVLPPEWRHLLMVGVLGAFTTFSAFSLELVMLLHQDRWTTALGYLLTSVVFCLAGCAGGIALARWALNG
ncbi:MAG: CrcB family protein [Spongiibacteraceae bacterium]|jgi:CrcB protein|nr:CrcB family protein [Spongiibacteraceae bacterium]